MFQNKRVIEVGAGVGLPGFFASKFAGPSSMVITDREYFRAPVEAGIEINHLSCVEFSKFDWGDADDLKRISQLDPFDVMMAADVIYAEEQERLVNALLAVPAHANTVLVLAYTNRSAEDETYLRERLLGRLFEVLEEADGIMVLKKRSGR